METYIFIPGRNRSLSLAEIRALLNTSLGKDEFLIDSTSHNFFKIRSKHLNEDSVLDFFGKCGGFIKVGKVLDEDLPLLKLLPNEGKFKFGISGYSYTDYDRDLTDLIKDFRKMIKEEASSRGLRCRYIGAGKNTLSSGQINGSRLLEEGFELMIIKDRSKKTVIAKTLAVQNIEQFTHLDTEKPCTDVEMGVLPVKLARMMINLVEAAPGSVLWDPFCGSGTIILQGLLAGYDMIGSDISTDAIRCTGDNVRWLSEHYDLGERNYRLFHGDITRLEKKRVSELKKTYIKGVVFEPYMGPPMKRKVDPSYARKHLDNAAAMFRSTVEISEKILSDRIRIVGIMPSYNTRSGWMSIRNTEIFKKKWKIENFEGVGEDLHWDRSNSIIRRNLIIATLIR